MTGWDKNTVLQVQKEEGDLSLILRGEWSRTRPVVEDFLATLGEAGVKTACDLVPGQQFRPPQGRAFSTGMAAARIQLDPATLKANNFAALREILRGLESDLHLSGAALDFSRANIYEQAGKALHLRAEEYPDAFGVTEGEARAAIARNQAPADVTIYDNRSELNYQTPESPFVRAQRVARDVPDAAPPTPAGRGSARQAWMDQQVEIFPVKDGTARIFVHFDPDGNDAQSHFASQARANAFRAAAQGAGLKVEDNPAAIAALQSRQRSTNGVLLVVKSARDAFAASRVTKEQNLGLSDNGLQAISGSVKKGSFLAGLSRFFPPG